MERHSDTHKLKALENKAISYDCEADPPFVGYVSFFMFYWIYCQSKDYAVWCYFPSFIEGMQNRGWIWTLVTCTVSSSLTLQSICSVPFQSRRTRAHLYLSLSMLHWEKHTVFLDLHQHLRFLLEDFQYWRWTR